MSTPLRIMICAAESSGDALGAALIEALREHHDEVIFSGCGGAQMTRAGLASIFDIEPLSVIGPVEALRALPAAISGANALAHHGSEHQVDAAVFIDSWAFSQLAAKKIQKTSPSTKLFKYVAPQVWASRPGRAEKLAGLFDGVLTLFAFEPEWFEPHGVKTKLCGHPGFQQMMKGRGGGEEFRKRYDLGDTPLLVLAPGSRRAEIKYLAASFRGCVDILRSTVAQLRIVIPVAPSRDEEIHAAFGDWDAKPILIGSDEKNACFDAATVGLIASGTASTELAIAGTPMIVGYAADWLTAAWAKRVVTAPYASLVNIALGREVIPEFFQERCTAENLAGALLPLITQEEPRSRQIGAFPMALDRLGTAGPPAAQVAASTILQWLAE